VIGSAVKAADCDDDRPPRALWPTAPWYPRTRIRRRTAAPWSAELRPPSRSTRQRTPCRREGWCVARSCCRLAQPPWSTMSSGPKRLQPGC